MNKYIFINSSPNMDLVSQNILMMGKDVVNIFTKQYTPIYSSTHWALIGDQFINLTDRKGLPEADPKIANIKKPLVKIFHNRYVKGKLSMIDKSVANAAFQDYVLLTSRLWYQIPVNASVSKYSVDDIIKQNPSSKIVVSMLPLSGGGYNLTRWSTDYDLNEALGNDFYYFYTTFGRVDLFRDGEAIVTISPDGLKGADWIKLLNPAFSKFRFTPQSSMPCAINRDRWLKKINKNLFLLNDYSWQGLSVQMPYNWLKKILNYIT